jgi:hypothetical protein
MAYLRSPGVTEPAALISVQRSQPTTEATR